MQFLPDTNEEAHKQRSRNLSVTSCLNALDNCIAEYDDNNNETSIKKVVETKLVSFNAIIQKIDTLRQANNETLNNEDIVYENALDKTFESNEENSQHFNNHKDFSQTIWPTPPSFSLIRDSEIDDRKNNG